MAATNPFKVSDLIKKYGWTIMPYLSNLGVRSLAEAQVLFVDSGNTANGADADDGEHGHSFEKPLLTLDYAIGLCTANEGAIILLAPGHYEDYDDSTTGFDADVAGIVIVGLGSGSLRPRFDFDHANSKCIMGANDVQIKNVVFRPSVATVAIGLDYETGITGVVLEDVEFAMGEKGDGTDEFVKAIHLTSGNHDSKFKNVRITAHASCGGATHGIHIDAASDRLVFQNVVIDGPYATNGILEDAAGLNHIVENCSIDVTGTNYGFNGSSTYAKYTRNVDAGADDGIGTEFWVKKTLTSSGVVQTGIDVTGVSSTGELAIVDVVCKCDTTGLAAGTNFELLTNNAKGLLNFYVETVANLGGSVLTVDLASASVTGIKTVVEVGKKVIAKSTVANCTGTGTVDVYIKFQRLTAGATIAAA